MLQRIQTLYLLLAASGSAGLPYVFGLWSVESQPVFASEFLSYTALFWASALLALLAVIQFKKRQAQFVMGRINIILNLILLGLFVYRMLNLSGDSLESEKGIGMFIPIVSIVLLVLANKAIKKDEDLVKSVDRLR
jgi:hypothetical protein